MHRVVRLACALLCVASGLNSADLEEVIEASSPVAAHAVSRSKVFVAEEGDLIRVSARRAPQSEGIFGIRVQIYDTRKNLLATDDPEIEQAYFEWRAPRKDSYVVGVQNVSPADGFFSITLIRGSKAGVAIGDAESAEVRVFYATNRSPANDGRQAPYYTSVSQFGESYVMGTALVTIPREHRLGELEAPAIYRLEFKPNPEKHVILKTVSPESAKNVFDEIRKKAYEQKQHEAFVFIHGFNVPFEDAVRRTAQISYDLGFGGAPISFSWPSQGSTLAYLRDVTTADASAAALRAFLSDLAKQSGATTIHLFAHSMGNRVLARALETMKDAPQPRFREIALLAPDMDAELLRQMAAAIRSRASRVTLYSSSNDDALALSSKLAGRPRAGQRVQVIPGIDSIDASPAKTSILDFSHSYFGDSSSVLGDLYRLLQGQTADESFGLERVASAPGTYWRFKRVAR